MDIQISYDDLRKNKLMVATPMYGGSCHAIYHKSMINLAIKCTELGVPFRSEFLSNESLIPRARNFLADVFMRSEATHLMFIDSDIGFDSEAVIQMLILSSVTTQNDYDIIAGTYPKKHISWEKIKAAVDKGVADDDANVLERFVGDFVFNPLPGIQKIDIDTPAQVMETGTGFMMIKKSTFEVFKEKFPEYSYKPDHVRDEHFDGSREIHQYFQAEIDPVSRRYLSEDYWFCQKAREAGLKTWLCPWIQLAHAGSYIFSGSLRDLASIDQVATVDPDKIKKKSSYR